MSRLIVKNVPAYLNDSRLKDHFSSQGGEVTDTKILKRHDGTSRRFGFVGFKKEEEAQNALKYFNKTFIDTCKIDVRIAKNVSDTGGSVNMTEQSEYQQKSKGKKLPPVEQNHTGQKKFKNAKGVSFDQFMAIMAPKKKRKTWQNEEGQDGEAALNQSDFDTEIGKKERISKKQRSEDLNQTVATVASAEQSDAVEESTNDSIDAAVRDEGMTDMEYMYKRMKRKVGEDLEDDERKLAQDSGSEYKGPEDDEAGITTADEVDAEMLEKQVQERKKIEEKAKQDEANVDIIMTGGRLFIRNLPFEATEADLEGYFHKYGHVSQAHITLDKTSKKSKGIAFVTFTDPLHALAAYREADGSTFQGRLLHILPAVSLREDSKDASNVRDKKKRDLKASAAKDFNWSTLFMSADAVASSIAHRLGISKTDLLNPDEDSKAKKVSPAVRLALAETNIIQETKEYFEKEGIIIDAFQGKNAKRSDSVTLVKNIPFGTSSDNLRSLFEKFGKVERILMPPSGTIAIIEMENSVESKVAFRALAYKRIANSVLYLEKAPVGIISGSPREAAPLNNLSDKIGATVDEDILTSDATSTLFVKNLAFSTTDERLALVFSSFDDFMFARVQRRPSKNGAAKLSMGYGFVGFRSMEAARRAQRAMDKSLLDSHSLSVSFAKRGHDENDEAIAKGGHEAKNFAPTTKLIIKNLPFQASKKEVRDLFAAHGKLKSVRVPKKGAAGINSSFGGSAIGVRGFAFVEFVNQKEAENAFNSLKHTHLLGRHLILEWDHQSQESSQDQIENLRSKTARGLKDVGIRKEKLHLNEEDIRAAVSKDKSEKEDEEDDEDEG